MILILMSLIILSVIVLKFMIQKTKIHISEKTEEVFNFSKKQFVTKIANNNNLNFEIKHDLEDCYSFKHKVIGITNAEDNSIVGIANVSDTLACILTKKGRIKNVSINFFQYGAGGVFVIYYVLSNGEALILFFVALVLLLISLLLRIILYKEQKLIKQNKLLNLYSFTNEQRKYILYTSKELEMIKIILKIIIMVLLLVLFRIYLLA